MDELSSGPSQPRRSWPMWVALVALLAGALVMVVRQHRTRAAPPVPGPSTSATVPMAHHVFIPARRTTGGRTTVRLTFPDGSTADIAYPASLRLAEMGVRPYVTGWLSWGIGDCCFREVAVPAQGEAWFARGGPRIRWLDGADGGQVGLYPIPAGGPETMFLVYSFGDWRLGVAVSDEDRMVFEQEVRWARSLRGTLTQDGFLVLRGGGALHLSRAGTESLRDTETRPQLWFGQGFATRYDRWALPAEPRMVVLVPTPRCGPRDMPPQPDQNGTGGACLGRNIRLWVTGDQWFVRQVTRGLTVSRVHLASDQARTG